MQAILWDMDGVIVDSEPLYNEADAKLFASLGLPFGQKEIAAVTGVSHRVFGKLMKDWYPHLPYNEDELSEVYVKHLVDALHNGNVQLSPGVLTWLERAKSAGIKQIIASSSTAEMVGYVIERFDLLRYLDKSADSQYSIHGAITGSDVLLGKPHPDIFLKAAERLNVKPSDCLVIEDSTNGIKAAHAANMRVAAYTATNRHGLDQSAAHALFDVFDDETYTAIVR